LPPMPRKSVPFGAAQMKSQWLCAAIPKRKMEFACGNDLNG